MSDGEVKHWNPGNDTLHGVTLLIDREIGFALADFQGEIKPMIASARKDATGFMLIAGTDGEWDWESPPQSLDALLLDQIKDHRHTDGMIHTDEGHHDGGRLLARNVAKLETTLAAIRARFSPELAAIFPKL